VLQRMAVEQAVPGALDASDPEAAGIARLAALLPADETQLLYSLCLHGRTELGLAPDEYAALTMVLLRLLAFKPAEAGRGSAAAPEKKTLNEPQRQAAAATLRATAAAPSVGTTIVSTRLPIPAAVPAIGAPAGRVLPVVDPQVPPATRAVPRGQPASEVAGVPVRVQAESPRERALPAPAAVVATPEGDFWHGLVQQLAATEAVTALVRELALQSQLLARDEGHWMLRVERESLNQPASRERLRAALKAAGHDVALSVEVGAVADSPARRIAQAAAQRQQAAEQIILNDPFVQDMMRDFGAKIVPGSIKPTEKN